MNSHEFNGLQYAMPADIVRDEVSFVELIHNDLDLDRCEMSASNVRGGQVPKTDMIIQVQLCDQDFRTIRVHECMPQLVKAIELDGKGQIDSGQARMFQVVGIVQSFLGKVKLAAPCQGKSNPGITLNPISSLSLGWC